MDNKMTYDLRRLQLEQLTILDELKRVCQKNGLTFYLAYGSCLGAMRHKGFIPWDDDIDVLMPVEDYDKLMKLSKEFKHPFFLQNNFTDPDHTLAIARVRKKGTACIEEKDMGLKCHQGIFIDIYPQYKYPNGTIKRIKIVVASIIYRILLAGSPPQNHGKIIKLFGNILLYLFSIGGRDKNISKCLKILRENHNTDYVADLYGMDLTLTKVIKYPEAWFSKPKWVIFEGRKMPVPTKPISFLKKRYGSDCMEIPSLDKQKSYHKYAYVDFENEYNEKIDAVK